MSFIFALSSLRAEQDLYDTSLFPLRHEDDGFVDRTCPNSALDQRHEKVNVTDEMGAQSALPESRKVDVSNVAT